MKLDGKTTKTPSANRLSISYAAGTRRLVIDAGVVQSLKVFRREARIEAVVNIERDSETSLKGVFVSFSQFFRRLDCLLCCSLKVYQKPPGDLSYCRRLWTKDCLPTRRSPHFM